MIGVVAGILPVGLLPALPPRPWIVIAALASLVLLGRRGRIFRMLSGATLGCTLALWHGYELVDRRLAEHCNGTPMTLAGRISSLPRRSAMEDGTPRQRFEFRVDSATPVACGRLSLVLLSYYGEQAIAPGQRWRFRARMKKPWGLANPGAFNMQAWYAVTGISAVGSVSNGGATLIAEGDGLGGAFDRLRLSIRSRIEALPLDGDARAVLAAVTVADKSGITTGLWSLLQRLGINHLMVISGLHVGLVAGAGLLLGGTASRLLQLAGTTALWLPPMLALALATAYAGLAGYSVATQRALVMVASFIAAHLAGRNSGAENGLLLAALVVLLANPLAPLGSGFWLSFSAVASLLWLDYWQRGHRPVMRLCRTHLFMSLVMLPIGGWWFGGASLVAAPANLLMIPVIGMFVVPLALLATLCFLLGLPLEPWLWRVAGWPLEWLMPCLKAADALGGHWFYLHRSPGPLQLSLAVTGLAVLMTPSGKALRLAALMLLVPLLLPGARLPEAGEGVTRLAVLDVGQGTAVVVQAGSKALVYDTGGGDPAGLNMAGAVVLPYLRYRGITHLDTFIISHRDRDHSAGSDTILRALPVTRLRYGAPLPGLRGGRQCRAGEAWRWPGGQRFQFLSPAREHNLVSNDQSCVLRIVLGHHQLLLPGDIEGTRERELVRYWGDALASDWLLAGHHGSLTSTSIAWLKRVAPTTAVISNGNAHRFGHPHPVIETRLTEAGVTYWETAREGALEFEFRDGEVTGPRRFRAARRRFWM